MRTEPDPFPSMITGKRVIIIGPSMTIQGCNLGSYIDSFDVVIRLNKSVPIPPDLYNDIGSRTDILYNSCNRTDYPGENKLDPSFLQRNGIKYLRCPYPPISPFKYDIQAFQKRNRNRIPFGYIDPDYYRRIRHNLGTRPYTGTCAIADVLHHNVKELAVMGIDFYTYGYAQYYRLVSLRKLNRLRENGVHRRTPQINLIRRFYLLDDRLRLDNVLDKILLESYDSLVYSLQQQVAFSRTCISASQTYIESDHPLADLHEKIQNKNNKLKICILGSLHPESVQGSEIHGYDFMIDLYPQRKPPLMRKADLSVITDRNNVDYENYNEKAGVLVMESYRKEYQVQKSDKCDPRFVLYLNPLFAKYLHAALTQSVVPHGSLSPEVFIALYISAYFGDKAEIHVGHMKPHATWNRQKPRERQRAIHQRLLYRYLLKRGWIRTI